MDDLWLPIWYWLLGYTYFESFFKRRGSKLFSAAIYSDIGLRLSITIFMSILISFVEYGHRGGWTIMLKKLTELFKSVWQI